MNERILFYTFIFIFIATALLTLLALPGWVRIEEKYKKQLFKLLIVEVIGLVMTLGYNVLIKDVKIYPENWVAINYYNGKLMDSIQFKHGLYEGYRGVLTNDKKEALQRLTFPIEKSGNSRVLIKSMDHSDYLGGISKSSLNSNHFYENVRLEDDFRLTFINDSVEKIWEVKGQQIHNMNEWPFEIKVEADRFGFYYTIRNKNTNLFVEDRGILDDVENNKDRGPFIKNFGDNHYYYIKVLKADFKGETVFDLKKLVLE